MSDPRSGPPAPRSGFARVVLPGLALSALAAVAANQTWATARAVGSVTAPVTVAGHEVAPLGSPLSLVALACWGAILVLRVRARRVTAVLGAIACLGAVAAMVARWGQAEAQAVAAVPGSSAVVDASGSLWPWVGLTALLGSLLAFVLTVRLAARWPEMSRRYDSGSSQPTEGAHPAGRELWRALDEGADPTAESP